MNPPTEGKISKEAPVTQVTSYQKATSQVRPVHAHKILVSMDIFNLNVLTETSVKRVVDPVNEQFGKCDPLGLDQAWVYK